MKSKIILLLLLFCTISSIRLYSQERPKVALVLAGGGAKGIAHVQAIKAIEEVGLPIDMVVGTSMGSIIGGMYCVGYSPDSIISIIGSHDWMKLIMDNPDYGNNRISARTDDENYILRMSISKDRQLAGGRAGVIQGRNVMKFFRSLTSHLPDSISFADLPIPFACVATNAFDGSKKVFTEGDLSKCIRASMAIPTVFTPMRINDATYIDGGLVDNFPVDVARKMGADIIIGVDLVIPTTEEKMTNSAVDILMNVFDLNSQNLYQSNIKDADIYIPIDVTGYSAASFTDAAIDTLLQRGEYYTSLKIDDLRSLYERLMLNEPVHRTRVGEYAFANVNKADNQHRPTFRNMKENYLNSSINIGARFDNYEYASLLANARFLLNHKHHTMFEMSVRLGGRMGFNGEISTKTIGTQRIGTHYQLMHRDLGYYYDGNKAGQMTSYWHNMGVYAHQEFRKIQYSFGLNYDIHHYTDVLRNENVNRLKDVDFSIERYFTYYIEGEYNNMNRQYFSTRGSQIHLLAEIMTDNLYQYNHRDMIPIISFFWQKAMSVGNRFTFRPHFSARHFFVDENRTDLPFSQCTILGGFHRSMQVKQQMTMAGLAHMEIIDKKFTGVFGFTAQERIFKNHYACLRFDVSTMFDQFEKFATDDAMNWGIQGSYSVSTGFGPVTFAVGYNSISNSVEATFNAGYCF